MKILVYPHDMDMGGSQLNAIELAAAVRDRGHEVFITGRPGSLESRVRDLGLDFIPLPAPGRRPSPRIIDALRRIVAERGIDVVHGYEWPPALEGLLSCTTSGATTVATILSMSVAPFIPTHMPILVGTEQIADVERASGRQQVELMEPPIDVVQNSPGQDLPVEAMAHRWGIHRRGLTLVIVSRLAHEMKLEGILAAIEVVGTMDPKQNAQLLIVGDGPAREIVSEAARKVNATAGEQRVVMTGELADPRWAYSIADVVLGMGGSALRGMAMGKPLIVQGEQGYWRTLTEESLGVFLWQGWYGCGPGEQHGGSALRRELEPLISNRQLRSRLAALSLHTIKDRFSLEAAATRQIAFYEKVLFESKVVGLWDPRNLRAALRFAVYKAGRLTGRVHGAKKVDDFNALATLKVSARDVSTQVRP